MNTNQSSTLDAIRQDSLFCSEHLHLTLAESKACKRLSSASVASDSPNQSNETRDTSGLNFAPSANDHPGNPRNETRAVIYTTTHKGQQIEIAKEDNGFVAYIGNKPLTQFENPLEPYWFSTSFLATQSAKQTIDRASD